MPWAHTAGFACAANAEFLGAHFRTGKITFGGTQHVISIHNYTVDVASTVPTTRTVFRNIGSPLRSKQDGAGDRSQ